MGMAWLSTQFTSFTNLSLHYASRSSSVVIVVVLGWGYSSFCEEPKANICPGSDIFFGKEGIMIYYQVMYCGDQLKFVVLQEILLTNRALPVSEKYPLMPFYGNYL